MAHFAQIVDGMVVDVVVIDNKDCDGGVFPDSEIIGKEFIESIGLSGYWIQCSYNNNFRGWFPSVGYSYNEEADVFISPQPSAGYVLDEESFQWVSPSGSRLPR